MRSTFVLFGLVAVALANLIQNAEEMKDVSDTQGSNVEADTPTRMYERAPCCSIGLNGNVCDCYQNEECCILTHPPLLP
ncbi:hypothetical protein E4U60_002831 [Claviceps pazoutovae]|uniref:Uncharacterized protein n=1 Tax=Claviceps pazoutovae TaxID=1649127 RepID=A0A9P7SGJ6_9HYPO|nr:hypothetical protein E4U60_002831 [Claviceps pazoutovae]